MTEVLALDSRSFLLGSHRLIVEDVVDVLAVFAFFRLLRMVTVCRLCSSLASVATATRRSSGMGLTTFSRTTTTRFNADFLASFKDALEKSLRVRERNGRACGHRGVLQGAC